MFKEKTIKLLEHCNLPNGGRKENYDRLIKEFSKKAVEKKFKELESRGYVRRPEAGTSYVYAQLTDKGVNALRGNILDKVAS